MACSKKRKRDQRKRKGRPDQKGRSRQRTHKQSKPNRSRPKFHTAEQLIDSYVAEIFDDFQMGVEKEFIPVDDFGLFELQLPIDDSGGVHSHSVALQPLEGSVDTPYEGLAGYHASKRSCGLAAVMQGAIEPSSRMAADLIPSDDDDPHRFDLRVLFLVMRDGRVLKRLCLLGGKRQGEQIDDYAETRLPEYMLRALGVEVEEPAQPARVFWARMWVEAALSGLSRARRNGEPLDTAPWRPRPFTTCQRDASALYMWPGWVNDDSASCIEIDPVGNVEVVPAHDQWGVVYDFMHRMARKGRAGELTPDIIEWMGPSLLGSELLFVNTTPLADSLPALADLDQELAGELEATFAELEVTDGATCAIE